MLSEVLTCHSIIRMCTNMVKKVFLQIYLLLHHCRIVIVDIIAQFRAECLVCDLA